MTIIMGKVAWPEKRQMKENSAEREPMASEATTLFNYAYLIKIVGSFLAAQKILRKWQNGTSKFNQISEWIFNVYCWLSWCRDNRNSSMTCQQWDRQRFSEVDEWMAVIESKLNGTEWMNDGVRMGNDHHKFKITMFFIRNCRAS